MKKDDCPNTIILTAKGKWQKEVGLEFVRLHNIVKEVRNEMKWCKWLVCALFLAIGINIIINLL